jgi:2-dehydropantoate 2-reductase
VRVVVYGAGAIGSLFGAYLARAGHSVLLIARIEHVAQVRSAGLRVSGAFEGTFHVDAATDLAPGPAPDALLLTVKTFDLESAAAALGGALPPGLPILLPQNGLGVLEVIRSGLEAAGWSSPERFLVRGVNSIPAMWVGPGEVRATGEGELVLPEPSGPAAAAVARFEELFRGTGLRLRTSADLTREVWRKVVVNAAINPVTARHGVVNGRLLEPEFREETEALLGEAVDAARSLGLDLTLEESQRDFERVVRATAENRSSMLQDLDRGRPTEIEAISGAIFQIGRKHRLDMWATERALVDLRTRAAEHRGPEREAS